MNLAMAMPRLAIIAAITALVEPSVDIGFELSLRLSVYRARIEQETLRFQSTLHRDLRNHRRQKTCRVQDLCK